MLALATALVPLLAVALGASLAVQLAQSGPMFRPAQAAPTLPASARWSGCGVYGRRAVSRGWHSDC